VLHSLSSLVQEEAERNRDLLHGSKRRHDVDRVGTSCNGHSGHLDGIAVLDIIALTRLDWWWWWWRRSTAKRMIIVSRWRWDRVVVVDHSSASAAMLDTASTKACTASSNQCKNDDESEHDGDECDDATDYIDQIKDHIKIAVHPRKARSVRSISDPLAAIGASVVLVANTNVHHIRWVTVHALLGARSIASVKSYVLADAHEQAHRNARLYASSIHAEAKVGEIVL